MKRILALSLVLAVAIAGLYLAQRKMHVDAVSPNAVLDATAEFQRDVSRAPMQVARLPDDSEIRIGNELAEEYLSTEPTQSAEMHTIEKYVSGVGDRVAAHAHRKLPYRFHLVANPDLINAFALPGGHVFVSLGLLHEMTSEDELACVLGHEIEHIDHYHAAERIQIEAQLKNIDLGAIAALTLIPLELWEAGYSKEQELEADREGLRLAAAAGYSPQGAVNLFERWAELHREYVTHARTPVDELSQVAIEGLQGYFRSHPLPEERLEETKKVIAEDGLDVTEQLTPLAVSSLLQTKHSLASAAKNIGDAQLGR
jgi:predicted Zn-dependent protease